MRDIFKSWVNIISSAACIFICSLALLFLMEYSPAAANATVKKVILAVAHEGYQPYEYQRPRAILEGEGVKVVTASDKPGIATAADGSKTKVDLTLGELDLATYDGLFLIGGPGGLTHLDNAVTHQLVQEMARLGKPFGAICISPRILAHAGVLRGKRAVGWNGDNRLAGIFRKYGVSYIRKPVVIDGKIVTAVGPQAADEFGQAILSVLGL